MPFNSETNPKVKLTKDQVNSIKQSLKKGIAVKDLANEYNVSPSAISRIKRNKTWKEEEK